MTKDKKKYIFTLSRAGMYLFSTASIFVASLIFFVFAPIAYSATTDNMSGWAWSNNVGWISFNCTTGGSTANNICPTSNYGVNKDVSGNLMGYAWSDNIGWIKFGGLLGFPTVGGTVTQNARVTPGAGATTFEGWARACAGTSNPSTCSDVVTPPAGPSTIIFDYGATTPVSVAGVTSTGSGQYTWTVPAGVTSVDVKVWSGGEEGVQVLNISILGGVAEGGL